MQGPRTDKEINATEGIRRTGPKRISIQVGGRTFVARFEEQDAPRTCQLFRQMLPLRSSLVHCRWSGESMWVPYDPPSIPIAYENQTSHPHPGQVLLYAQEMSEPEILMPYGACSFSSKVGQLAGNHFLTLTEGIEELRDLGRSILWDGAKEIVFELIS
jgi:Protein of unknown function (DUF3830)